MADQKRHMNATEEQKQILLNFMEDNVDFGKGKFIESAEGKRKHKSLWDVLAQSLNSAVDGPTRGTAKWQRYWSDMKTRVKRKVTDIKKSQEATGGGLLLPKSLSDFEERVLIFISPEPAYGVRDPESIDADVKLESDIPVKRSRTPQEIQEIEEQPGGFSETEISAPNTPISGIESILDISLGTSREATVLTTPSTSKRKVITRSDVTTLLQQQTELNMQLVTLNSKLDNIQATLERNNAQTNQVLERIAVALEKRLNS